VQNKQAINNRSLSRARAPAWGRFTVGRERRAFSEAEGRESSANHPYALQQRSDGLFSKPHLASFPSLRASSSSRSLTDFVLLKTAPKHALLLS
jgi:hypothetical protein